MAQPPQTQTSQTFDTIIIGAGIMGSCAAYEISKLNQKVLLLDQFDLLHPLGSSHGESRTFRATYPEPYYSPMALHSLLLWQSAESSSGYSVLTPTPHLDLVPSDSPSLQSILLSYPPNSPAPSVSTADPTPFRLPQSWTAISTPTGGVIKPIKAVAMFQSLAIQSGAVILDRTAVVQIDRNPSSQIRVTTADNRVFYSKKCVVTAGAWTGKLIKRVSKRDFPVQPLHTLIWYWKIKEGFRAEMSRAGGFPTFASYGSPFIYGTPEMEFPGLVKVSVHGGWVCDPDCREWGLDGGEMVGRVAEWIERVLPGRVETGIGPVVEQSCMYSMSPDEDFVIDFLGGEFGKDVVVAGGFSGHGFKMGPLVGKIVAEMVDGGESTTAARIGVDMKVFGLGRFEGGGKGNVKEFGEQVNFHHPQ